jgi:putative ABC transport system permease protein
VSRDSFTRDSFTILAEPAGVIRRFSHNMTATIAASVLHDLRLAFRTWTRRRAVGAFCVTTIVVGITGSVVVFSVADAILWHPLPFRDADRLVSLWSFLPQQHSMRAAIRLASLDVWDQRDRLFSDVYVYGMGGFSITGHGDAQAVTGARISRGLFSGLVVSPKIGRDFGSGDFVSGAEHVIVLSDRLWRSRFGAQATAIGEVLNVDDVPYRVIGAMPPHFSFPVENVQFWIPLTSEPHGAADWFNAVAMLRPGVTIAAAAAATEAMTHGLRARDGVRLPELRVRPFTRRLPQTELILWIFGGAVGLVLLIAVANAANLLLADSVQREAELATRAAIGATMAQLVRQALAEATVIAIAAAGLAVVLASTVTDLVAASLPRIMAVQTLRPISMDWRGGIVAVLVATVSTCAAALAPLSRLRRIIEGAARRSGSEGSRTTGLRSTLVVAQVAVTLVVLAAAALLAKGFIKLQHADVGYDPNNLLSVSVQLRGDVFKANIAKEQFLDELRHAAGVIPGVVSATVTESIPPQLGFAAGPIDSDDGQSIAESATIAQASVDDQFFRTMGIPLLRGGLPTAARATDARRPAVVSRSLAAAVWHEQDPTGHTFRISRADPWYVVMGVAGDVQNGSFESPLGTFAVYEPRSVQPNIWHFQSLIVRTTGDTRRVEVAIREIVKRLNGNVPITNVDAASALIVDINSRVQFATWLMIAFASVATFLALIGVYGSFSCVVRQRTHEIAVRMALGAEPSDVVRMVLTATGRCALAGVVIGLPLALGLSRALRSLLFATSPNDPVTYVVVCLMLVTAAIGAAWYPAFRASRIDPAETLRTQ